MKHCNQDGHSSSNHLKCEEYEAPEYFSIPVFLSTSILNPHREYEERVGEYEYEHLEGVQVSECRSCVVGDQVKKGMHRNNNPNVRDIQLPIMLKRMRKIGTSLVTNWKKYTKPRQLFCKMLR